MKPLDPKQNEVCKLLKCELGVKINVTRVTKGPKIIEKVNRAIGEVKRLNQNRESDEKCWL